MGKILLLALILGLLVLWQPAEGSEFTILYSNDTIGFIDPCPT
jgi:hypothetical protein